jgi:hypothetical protein
MAALRTQRSLDRAVPTSLSVPYVEQFDSDSDEEAIVVDERFGAAIPTLSAHTATNSSQNMSNNDSAGHGPDVRSIIVGILHASKPVSAAPAVHSTAKPPLARPTSASSVSRRQIAASLDPPFLKERGAPPLHSSQPVVFRKQKPSPAPFGVSGPRMLIDVSVACCLDFLRKVSSCQICSCLQWEGGRDFGPAPGMYD